VSEPRWQVSSIYAGLDSDDYRAARAEIRERLARLEELADEHALGAGPPLEPDARSVALVERLLDEVNALLDVMRTVWTFLTGFIAADAFDDEAQAEASSLRRDNGRGAAFEARMTAWLGRFDPGRLAGSSDTARDHAEFLRRAAHYARHQMGDEAEELAAALDESSGGAWERLHEDIVARSTISVDLPGRESEGPLGLAALINLQSDADRAVRGAAYAAEVELLERFDVAHAAAMNGIKGQVRTLTQRRGWDDVVELATFEQGISPSTLAALQEAVEGAFPTLRRYLRAKARLLGLPRLAWYDRLAPLPTADATRFGWYEAIAFVAKRFERFSPALAALARRAADDGWIDVPPRRGKRSGAFCASAPLVGESRIMLNWGGTLGDVTTLAHELGHAYHNDAVHRFGRTSLQTRKPMTLAETASMFCETLVIEAMLEHAEGSQRLAVLEEALSTASAITVDIHSRFLFERAVFERRGERELSVAELDALMLEAQAATYGDGLAEDARFAKAWAEKPHYYSSDLSFYNFPYTFGYLFGLGLYARYQADPEGFVARYDTLLASTGMDEVAALTRSMDIDVEDPAFWQTGLGIVAARVEEYEAAAAEESTP
jgi:oligoendopeptidase F